MRRCDWGGLREIIEKGAILIIKCTLEDQKRRKVAIRKCRKRINIAKREFIKRCEILPGVVRKLKSNSRGINLFPIL